MTELPPGWEWAKLDEIAVWSSGGTPKASNPNYYGGSIPWAVIGDLNDEVTTKTASCITQDGLDNSSAKIAPTGAVLMAMYGTIGKLGIAGTPMATNQAIAFARDIFIDTKYLFWYLMSQRQPFQRSGKGATQKNISQAIIRAWPIPIAPLAEQRRLVAALEDHLSRLRSGADALISAERKAELIERSAAHYATSGSLGDPGTPRPQQGEEELREILRRRSDLITKTRRKPTPNSTSAQVPDGWAMASLGQLAWNIEYGTSAKADPNKDGHAIPVIRMGNIRDGKLDSSNLKFLSDAHPDSRKLRLQDGDVLFNRTNSAELVGKSAVYRRTFGPAIFASYLIRCQLVDGVDPDWVSLVINSPYGRRHISTVASQQVGQANVNGTKLAEFPVPLPPIRHQRAILAAYNQIREDRDRVMIAAELANKRSEQLRRSILLEAFTGRLVSQDPDDESASVLLERIRTERATQPRAKQTRRTTKQKDALL